VKYFFDTSVLVPVFLPDHDHHERSFAAFSGANPRSAGCAGHSLAEVYATLTRLPGRHRLSGEQALLFLEEIEERLSIVALESGEYLAAIRRAGAAGIVGGALYDYLLAACALKAKAEILYTWNTRDFSHLGSEVAKRVRTP
jgi:predicted nucleic acid-binding protein